MLDEADHMADLGFLPAVKRLLDQTPGNGQRMLFSATLDNAIDVLVKRYLDKPAVHEADSAQSPVAKMDHHVLHINREHRVSVLVDLASAPGRTILFTRTKHGAKALARQLNKSGVPTVDLHGNLSQGARTRNMEAFHSGKATTLVATDIAARGIHVDDVALVVHADPPMEHKAYLHRSGRTARAGAAGTVITLMTDDQRRDVQQPHPGRRHQAADHAHRQRVGTRCSRPSPPACVSSPVASPRPRAPARAAGPPAAVAAAVVVAAAVAAVVAHAAVRAAASPAARAARPSRVARAAARVVASPSRRPVAPAAATAPPPSAVVASRAGCGRCGRRPPRRRSPGRRPTAA